MSRRNPRKPGPKPGFQPAVNQRRIVARAAAAAKKTAGSQDPLQRGRDIASMDEPELRAYAKQVGVCGRDVTGLSVDRLRQNCALVLNSRLEALME